jgi:tetratricopeptide (TPR) repeat protein
MILFRERITEIDRLIRASKLDPASAELRKLHRSLSQEAFSERIQVAELSRRIGQPELGLSSLKPLREARWDWLEARLAWAGCLMDLGAATAAAKILEECSSKDWRVQKQLGFAQIARRDYSSALKHLNAALGLNSYDEYQSQILKINVMSCHLQLANFEEFETLASELSEEKDETHSLLNNWIPTLRAELACHQGRWSGALAEIARVSGMTQQTGRLSESQSLWKQVARAGLGEISNSELLDLSDSLWARGSYELAREAMNFYLRLANHEWDRRKKPDRVTHLVSNTIRDRIAEPTQIHHIQNLSQLEAQSLGQIVGDVFNPQTVLGLAIQNWPEDEWDMTRLRSRMDRLLARIRSKLQEQGIPLALETHRGRVIPRAQGTQGFCLQISSPDSKSVEWVKHLRGPIDEKGLAKALGVSRFRARRMLRHAEESAFLRQDSAKVWVPTKKAA